MMIRCLFLVVTGLLAFIGSSSINHAGNEIDEALQARAQGLPQVTIAKLSDLLVGISSGNPKKGRILRELGQSFLETGQLTNALRVLRDPVLSSDSAARFWLAQSLAAQGEFSQALPLYQDVLATNADLKSYAVLGAVRMLRALGKNTEALATLADLPSGGNPVTTQAVVEQATIFLNLKRVDNASAILNSNPEASASAWGRYLSARVAMLKGYWDSANIILGNIRPKNDELIKDILLARSECFIQSGDLSSAENILSKFIQKYPQHPALPILFAKLDEVYDREHSPSSSDLRRWGEDAEHPLRASYARFYCARNDLRISRLESAMGLFREFISDLPIHPLTNAARVEIAQQYLSVNKAQDALDILSGFRPNLPGAVEIAENVELLRGAAWFALNRYTEAAEAFLSAAHRDPSPQAETALYNAALASLLAGNSNTSNPAQLELKQRYPEGHAIQELRLVEALQKTKKGDPNAGKALDAIADTLPRARLALAELRFAANNPQEAVTQWALFTETSDAHDDRAAYLAIFLADNGDEEAEDRVTRLARDFLNAYPHSPFKPEIRLKLGEVFFRCGNFLGARIQFESLARESPDSPLAESALFFAGQSSMQTMDASGIENAMLIFEEVAKIGGPLALQARLEQAQLQEAAGHPDQTLLILENILASKPNVDIRFEALMAKGNTYFSQGTVSSENYSKAIEAWRQISSSHNASTPWKNQALTKIGAAYQKLGDTDQALASYYDVFSAPNPSDPEFFWFYKAGFDAGKLLESKQCWKEAIVVYKQMTRIAGPRSEEARNRMKRLQLEHLIEK